MFCALTQHWCAYPRGSECLPPRRREIHFGARAGFFPLHSFHFSRCVRSDHLLISFPGKAEACSYPQGGQSNAVLTRHQFSVLPTPIIDPWINDQFFCCVVSIVKSSYFPPTKLPYHYFGYKSVSEIAFFQCEARAL